MRSEILKNISDELDNVYLTGNLLIRNTVSKNNTMIVMCIENNDNYSFRGVIVYSLSSQSVGDIFVFEKSHFKLFKGEIKLIQ